MDGARGYVKRGGEVVPFGQTKQVWEYRTMFGETLPSWLVTSNSSSAVGTPAASGGAIAHSDSADGYYSVGTGASPVVGDEACLVGPIIQLTRVRAVHWEIEGLYWSNAYADTLLAGLRIGMRGFGATTGAYLQQGSTDDTVGFYVAGQTPKQGEAGVRWRNYGEADKKRNVGLLMLPTTKELLLTDSGLDRVVGYHDAEATMTLGAVRPYVRIGGATDGVQKTFRFSTARLTIWRD